MGDHESREPVEIPFDNIIHQTPEAVLFDVGDEEVWIPKSLIQEIDESDPKRKTVTIPEWVATDKGLV